MPSKKPTPTNKKKPQQKPQPTQDQQQMQSGADFGFEIQPNEQQPVANNLPSVIEKQTDDGAVVVSDGGGSYGIYLDMDNVVKNEAELITRYREMSLQPEIESAVDDIINEMIAYDEKADLVKLNLDQLSDLSESIKNIFREEFEQIINLLDFNNSAYEICRRWYIDGRMIYQVLIDDQHPEEGIQELRYIDPRKIRKVREVTHIKTTNGVATPVIKNKREYWIYNDKGFAVKNLNTTGYQSTVGVKISDDSIVQATSGLMDPTNRMVLGWLHKASKPLNQLRDMEDAAVIYRLVRAPSRRVFYIDVGNLPRAKAEQYMRDQMVRHKNKIVYDSATGQIRDQRKFLNMLEDYWLPRRNGQSGTEITNLEGGQSLAELSDVTYFQQRLYRALNIPISRLQDQNTGFNLGRSSEITRDELKFSKFIARLRLRFSRLLKTILEKQLILRNVISKEEAPALFQKISFDFKQDNHFTEFKNLEVQRERIGTLQVADPFVGKYFSLNWVKRNILNQDEEQIEDMQEQMDEELPQLLKLQALQAGMLDQNGNIIPQAPPGGEGGPPQDDQGDQFAGQGLPGGPAGPPPKGK